MIPRPWTHLLGSEGGAGGGPAAAMILISSGVQVWLALTACADGSGEAQLLTAISHCNSRQNSALK